MLKTADNQLKSAYNRLRQPATYFAGHDKKLLSTKLEEPSCTAPVSSNASIDLLTWDDTYALVLALRRDHPGVDLEQVSLGMIYTWTLALKEFHDDPQLVNEAILASIYQEWFEEVITI